MKIASKKIAQEDYEEVVFAYLSDPDATAASLSRRFKDRFRAPSARLIRDVLGACGLQVIEGFRFNGKRSDGWTAGNEATLKEMYGAGVATKELAAHFGIGVPAVLSHLRKMGLKGRKRPWTQHKFTEAQEREIIAAYGQGASQDSLGKRFGCAQTTIANLLRRFRIPTRALAGQILENHPNWRGGQKDKTTGYRQVKLATSDPYFGMTCAGGYVLEHRLVMARAIGRPLFEWETVHHLRERDNNALENLQLRIGQHGSGQSFVCGDCGSHNVIPERLRDAPEGQS